jgi:carbonic anhydrase
MEKLLSGYRAFREQRWPRERALYAALAQGQSPRLLIIGCSDSRVDPATIFDAGPGELFVVRNVANLVPPFEQGDGLHGTSAAIEFAVKKLKVSAILVLGHARCGGVTAALQEEALTDTQFLVPWIGLLAPAKARCAHLHGDLQTALERESIRLSLQRLHEFSFIREAMERDGLKLHGARFDIADGSLELLSAETGDFLHLA